MNMNSLSTLLASVTAGVAGTLVYHFVLNVIKLLIFYSYYFDDISMDLIFSRNSMKRGPILVRSLYT